MTFFETTKVIRAIAIFNSSFLNHLTPKCIHFYNHGCINYLPRSSDNFFSKVHDSDLLKSDLHKLFSIFVSSLRFWSNICLFCLCFLPFKWDAILPEGTFTLHKMHKVGKISFFCIFFKLTSPKIHRIMNCKLLLN